MTGHVQAFPRLHVSLEAIWELQLLNIASNKNENEKRASHISSTQVNTNHQVAIITNHKQIMLSNQSERFIDQSDI